MSSVRARLTSGSALLILSLSATLPALAQEAGDDAEVINLDAIVISAEDQIKQALGVSQVTEADLRKLPVVNDIAEIVRKQPGGVVTLTEGLAGKAVNEGLRRCWLLLSTCGELPSGGSEWSGRRVGELERRNNCGRLNGWTRSVAGRLASDDPASRALAFGTVNGCSRHDC